MVKSFFGERRIVASLVFFILLFPFTPTAAFYNAKSPIGTNTNEVLEEDSSVPFIDLFKGSLPFRYAKPLTRGTVQYDENGWPKYIAANSQAGTRFVNKLPVGTIPQGYYTVLYDGQGKIEYGNDATLVESHPGRDVIMLQSGADKTYSGKLIISQTDPSNYIRNIRILPPGGICSSNPLQRVMNASQCPKRDYLAFERHYDKIIFNPDYLRHIREYKVLRFMNMSGITRNPIQHWNKRPHLQQANWGGPEGVRGVPLEVMIELANRVGADPWFTLPHAADNHFVESFARMVKKNLNPNLKVYVEYSNETWNGIFSQHQYMKQMGQRYKLDTDELQGAYKYYSKRSVEMFRIFEKAFAGKERLIRVMGGLTGNKRMTQTMLKFNNAHRYTDAFAVAPYVWGDTDALRKSRTTSDMFRIMTDKRYRYSLPKVIEAIKQQVGVLSPMGIDLIAYEGGQHLVDWKTKSNTQHPNPLFYKTNQHNQMATIYKRLLDGWKQAGGKMFIHYSTPRIYQKYGSFGDKEYLNQPLKKAPKYMAILSFIRHNPCWWQNCSNPSLSKTPSRSLTQLAGQTAAKPVPVKPTEPKAPQVAQKQSNETTPTAPAKPIPASYKPHVNPYRIKVAEREIAHEAFSNGAAMIRQVRDMGNIWKGASSFRLRNVVSGNIAGKSDLSAIWQATWDYRHLYLRISVDDDQFMLDSANLWEDDAIELYLDMDTSRLAHYDRRNDHHLLFRWGNQGATFGPYSAPQRLQLGFNMKKFGHSYILETKIPWTSLGARPRVGFNFGLDIHINDDDNGQGRDGKLTWSDRRDESWRSPSMFGRATLAR